MRYIFNHYYILKHDECRTVLCSHDYNSSSVDISKGFMSYIHPIYAMLFSFFSKPTTYDDAIERISTFFDFSTEYTKSFVDIFIENAEKFHTKYAEHTNRFPKNLIIKEELSRYKIRTYEPQMFVYQKIDLDTFRQYTSPLHVTFMVNNRCLTDCIYCYADKSTKCKNMDFQKVEHIIDEAYSLNINSFNVDGGEFFIYPHWRSLLKKLQECEYKPNIISTKYPITEKDIVDFSTFGLSLQVSLDSLNQDVLNRMVGNIPDYSKKMQRTLQIINSHIPFQIATILTRFNSDIAELECMYHFFCKLKNIRRWEIRVGFKSLYTNKKFEEILINKREILAIESWIKEKQKESPFEILWSPGHEIDFFKAENGSRDFIGNRCSANTIHMFILPDGKVTICEQLYWKPRFIIGDLTTNTISEVWNSKKSLFLAQMRQKEYSEDSACRKCNIFDKCKSYMNNCYANILKVYGDEHWDYPDPRCMKAPRNISENIYV